MKKCGICKRKHEHLGIPIKTTWCEPAKDYVCKDCCLKNGGMKCAWKTICWDQIT